MESCGIHRNRTCPAKLKKQGIKSENKQIISSGTAMRDCPNPYAERLVLSSLQSDILAGFFMALAPFGVAANVLVIWALVKTRAIYNKRCRINWILLSISMSDLTVGMVTLPLIAILFTKYPFIRWCDFEKAIQFIGQVNLHFSAYNLLFLGLEQWLHLDPKIGSRNSQRAKKLTTNRGLLFIIVTSFFLSVCHGIISTTSFENRTVPDTVNGILNFGLYLFSVFFFVGMYLRIRKASKETNSVLQAENELKNSKVPPYIQKLAKFVSLLLLASSVCYLPFLVIELAFVGIKFIQHKPISPTLRFINFVTWLPVLFYSTLNAVIIIHVRSNIRKFVLGKVCFKSQSHSIEGVASNSQSNVNHHNVNYPLRQVTMEDSLSPMSSPGSITRNIVKK